MIFHFLGKYTIFQTSGKFFCQRKIFCFLSLTNTDIPKSIVHNICIINIGTYKERIMWFQYLIDVPGQISHNCSGKQHTAGFSAYHAGSDHMIPDTEIVFRRKMLFYHKTHFSVSGHHNIAHCIAGLFCIHVIVIQHPGSIEKTIPGICKLFFAWSLKFAENLIKTAGLYSIQDRTECSQFFVVNMWQKHGF